jgi:acetyl-CoA carboxylase carboxyltransferase component
LPHVASDASIDDPAKPARDPHDLYKIVSGDGQANYDVRDLLACVVDDGTLQEYKAGYGKTLVCAYAALGGRSVGIVASQRALVKSSRGTQIGGVIYDDSADKAARFVMDCSQTQLPIVFFQDVQGFMVGRDSEQRGIIRSGAKLVNAVSNSRRGRLVRSRELRAVRQGIRSQLHFRLAGRPVCGDGRAAGRRHAGVIGTPQGRKGRCEAGCGRFGISGA